MKARSLCVVVLLAGSATAAIAETAGDVLKSFRKLEASTVAGITLSEYSRAMADVDAQLKSYSDTNQGRPTPESIKALTAAFAQYQKARAVWDEQEGLDYRYQQGNVTINDYYDRKREIIKEVSGLWRTASAEIDRAARSQKK